VWFPVPHVGLDPRSLPRFANARHSRVRSIFKSPSPGGDCQGRLAILHGRILRTSPPVGGELNAAHARLASEQTPQPDDWVRRTSARTQRRRPNWPLPCGVDVRRGPRLPFRGHFEILAARSGAAHIRVKPARTISASKRGTSIHLSNERDQSFPGYASLGQSLTGPRLIPVAIRSLRRTVGQSDEKLRIIPFPSAIANPMGRAAHQT
jgi:hypothetical protein